MPADMDVIEFLTAHPFRGFVWALARQDTYPQVLKPILFPIHVRVLALYGFSKGYLGFTDAIRLMLPGRYKTEALKKKYAEYIRTEITKTAKKHLEPYLSEDGAISLFGSKFWPYKGNYGELIDLLTQVMVLDQYSIETYLKEESTVLDIGANIGSFSVFAAHTKKSLTMYSFEPAKGTFETLQKNTAAYKNIFCQHMGLGDTSRTGKMRVEEHATVGNTLSYHDFEGAELSEDVTISTVDQFVTEHGLTRVDFIKMDTEGYEAQIIRGAKDTIQKFRPVIAMSAYHHPEDKDVLPELIASIDATYTCRLVSADEEIFIFIPS